MNFIEAINKRKIKEQFELTQTNKVKLINYINKDIFTVTFNVAYKSYC